MSWRSSLSNPVFSMGGEAAISTSIKKDMRRVAKILNIEWVERGLEGSASPAGTARKSLEMTDVRREILEGPLTKV